VIYGEFSHRFKIQLVDMSKKIWRGLAFGMAVVYGLEILIALIFVQNVYLRTHHFADSFALKTGVLFILSVAGIYFLRQDEKTISASKGKEYAGYLFTLIPLVIFIVDILGNI